MILIMIIVPQVTHWNKEAEELVAFMFGAEMREVSDDDHAATDDAADAADAADGVYAFAQPAVRAAAADAKAAAAAAVAASAAATAAAAVVTTAATAAAVVVQASTAAAVAVTAAVTAATAAGKPSLKLPLTPPPPAATIPSHHNTAVSSLEGVLGKASLNPPAAAVAAAAAGVVSPTNKKPVSPLLISPQLPLPVSVDVEGEGEEEEGEDNEDEGEEGEEGGNAAWELWESPTGSWQIEYEEPVLWELHFWAQVCTQVTYSSPLFPTLPHCCPLVVFPIALLAASSFCAVLRSHVARAQRPRDQGAARRFACGPPDDRGAACAREPLQTGPDAGESLIAR